MNYKNPCNYHLTPSRKKVWKAVARVSTKMHKRFQNEDVHNSADGTTAGQLRNELTSLCSEAANSVLRNQSADALRGFTWGKLHDELAARAPTLLSLIECCMYTRKPRCNRMAVIGMCAVLLLKLRFHRMCLVQKIVSLLL